MNDDIVIVRVLLSDSLYKNVDELVSYLECDVNSLLTEIVRLGVISLESKIFPEDMPDPPLDELFNPYGASK